MEGSKGPGAAGSVGEVFCSLWDAMEESEGPEAVESLGRLLGSQGGGHKSTQEGKDVFSDLAWACKGPVRRSPSQSGWLIPSKDLMTQANTVPEAWWACLQRQVIICHVRVHSHIYMLRGQINTICVPSLPMMNTRCFSQRVCILTSPALVYSNARLTRLPTALTSPRASPAAA